MPSVLTHYGFNKELFDNNISYLKNHEDLYLVGAQGPDPFFFYGIVPFFKSKNSKEVRKYGTTLHKLVPSDVFAFFFDYANKDDDKGLLYSYILGAGLHYVLDRKIHPYVFYKTGFSDDKNKKKKYFACHTLFETHLDVLLMNDRYKKYKVSSFKSIECDDDKIEKVSEMYCALAKEIVKDKSIEEDSFEDSYEHMFKIEKLLYSKRGIKKWFVNLLFKKTPFNTMMHPKIVKDDKEIDYLNLNKTVWKDPSTETIFNKSVIELIEEAKLESEKWFKIVNDYYIGKGNYEELMMFMDGYIYDGYKLGDKMKVFDNVYERKENK